MRTRLWITGATGFVGGHFLYSVLERSEMEIVALVRPRGAADGLARLLDSLEIVAGSYRQPLDREVVAARVRVVRGDITQAGCGVVAEDLPERDAGVRDELWHIAASLHFEDKHRERIRLHNVEGTRNALSLAERIGVARFVQVSTAYACGKTSGEVPETLHSLDREFNNAYEQSKCEAEHVVAAWEARSGVPVAIVRPSIVVGPRTTHDPGGSDTGLYGFTREIDRLRPMLRAAGQSLTMCGDAEAPLNLIPVDDAVREMWRLSQCAFAGGLVHHVTSHTQPSVERVLAVVGERCGIGPIATVPRRDGAVSPVEETIDRRATFYSSYLRDAKRFARRAGPRVHVSDEDLEHFVRQFVKARRGESVESVFHREQLRAPDGQLLVSHTAGDAQKPCFLLCNAYGVPSDVWVPLVGALAGDFHLLTWELRQSAGASGPEAHVADLGSVMDHHGIERAYVLGWCTGADVALRFAEQYPERVCGAVAVGGALNGAGAAETEFQRHMRMLVEKAAARQVYAELFHQILFGLGTNAEAGSDDRSMLSSMLHALDPALLHLTSAPFRDPFSLYRYARTMRDHYAHAQRFGLPCPSTETLLIVGAQDEVVHTEASRRATAVLPRARMVELDGADHFALYTDTRVGEVLRDFVQSTRADPVLDLATA